MEQERDRPGRKAQPANRGQRVSLGLKVTPVTKARLDATAKENGRTQSQEAEVRLEHSFRQQDLLAPALTLAYGPECAAILLTVARAFARNGRIGAVIARGGDPEARQGWHREPFAYDQAMKAARAVMERFRPTGDPRLLAADKATEEALDSRAEASVAIDFAAITDPRWGEQFPLEQRNRELEEFAAEVRELLGPELVARISAGSSDRRQS